MIGDSARRLTADADISALNFRLNSAFEIFHKLASGIGDLNLILLIQSLTLLLLLQAWKAEF